MTDGMNQSSANQRETAGAQTQPYLRVAQVVALLGMISAPLCGQTASCPVEHALRQDPAQAAMLAGHPERAAILFRTELAERPRQPEIAAGLVEALLAEQRIAEADATVTSALRQQPESSALITARGEVEYREGYPWKAAQSAEEAAHLDPCNASNMLLIARIARLESDYATAAHWATSAHTIRPDDPEIRREWIQYLPRQQQIEQLKTDLSQQSPDEPKNPLQVRRLVNHLREIDSVKSNGCHLTSDLHSARIDLEPLGSSPGHPFGIAMEMQLDSQPVRMQIDTGSGGLIVTQDVARRARLMRLGKSHLHGLGDGKAKGYLAFANSIRIGGLDFQNCIVRVIDNKERTLNGVDGLVGLNVFEPFLITLDYPRQRLLLSPLPLRPGKGPATPSLKTVDSTKQSPGLDAEAVESHAADRYIAPQMRSFMSVYRVGHELMVPVSLNEKELGLFVIDTGSWTTAISPSAAAKVTELHRTDLELNGLDGKIDNVYTAAHLTLRFASIEQQASNVVSFDMSKLSQQLGIEVSGILGTPTLDQLTMHLDYRDGLLKFDYAPNHGGAP